jgi:hypothetical protein
MGAAQCEALGVAEMLKLTQQAPSTDAQKALKKRQDGLCATSAEDFLACSKCGRHTWALAMAGKGCCFLCAAISGTGMTLVDVASVLYRKDTIEGAKGEHP